MLLPDRALCVAVREVSLQHAINLAYGEWLDDVLSASGGKRFGSRRRQLLTIKEDDWHIAHECEPTYTACRLEAVEHWKTIEEVGVRARCQRDSHLAVDRF